MKFTAFIMGMGAGAAIALIFAPRSGEETREMIAEKARKGRRFAEERARDLRDMAGDKAAQLREIASDKVAQARDMASDATERGKEVINRQKNAVSAAVQAGVDTYKREAPKIS